MSDTSAASGVTLRNRTARRTCRLAMGLAALLSLSACANFNTIDRTTRLPEQGTAIHLDAPQRLAYADGKGVICAEPTPDALQAYISSLGGSVSAGNNAASVSNALQANSHSVGLHSQSITLMREHLFRICAFAQNRWLSDGDVMMLMIRSQDLTLGVLAIEQLTGAAIPRQPAIPADPATAATSQLQSQLEQAQLDLGSKNTALHAALKPALTQLEGQTPDDNDSSAPDAAGARLALVSAQEKVASLERQLAESKVKTRQATLPGEGGNQLSPLAAEHIAKATEYIVDQVLHKDYLTDMCINMLNRFSRKDKKLPETYDEMMMRCDTVLQQAVARLAPAS